MMGIGMEITLIVSLTLVCITLWSAIVSSVIPMVLKRCGIDPAVVSAPFIATLIDGTGLIIYFKIAQYTLGLECNGHLWLRCPRRYISPADALSRAAAEPAPAGFSLLLLPGGLAHHQPGRQNRRHAQRIVVAAVQNTPHRLFALQIQIERYRG
jgi:hypothetical protein